MIRAAGTVLWREASAGVGQPRGDAGLAAGGIPAGEGAEQWEFALVHRPRYGDWSLPKGKAHAGEALWLTALRETAEETGVDAVLGPHLGHSDYRTPAGKKRVDWWLGRCGGEGEPGLAARPPELRGQIAQKEKRMRDAQAGKAEEIDELVWLAGEEAQARLTYASDREVLDWAWKLLHKGSGGGHAVALVRHGKAVRREHWDDGERTRPLTRRGEEQARGVALALAALGVGELVSSPWARCMATVQPYAEAAGLAIAEDVELTEDAFEHSEAGVRSAVAAACAARGVARDRVSDTLSHRGDQARDGVSDTLSHYDVYAGGVAICLHGPTLGAAVNEVARTARKKARRALPSKPWKKGSMLVLHTDSTGRVLTAELWKAPRM